MRKTSKKLLVILTSILVILNLFIPLFSNMTSNNRAIAYEDKVETLDDGTVIKSNGCLRVIEKTEKVEWSLPRKPIDLVILQDASGSFKNTIGSVQGALKNLTTFVSEKDYDENNPRLVKTSNPDTTDRVMVATFQGLDGILYYSDNNFKRYNSWRSLTGADAYQYRENSLTNNQEEIHNFIDNIRVNGGTPTVPAIDTLVEHYENTKGNMKNERKTVYLVITDGVANGYKHSDGNVYIDESLERSNKLLNYWRYRYDIIPEGSQDYLTRAKELKEAGTRLKSSAGENGTVVVGFWEDVPSFEGVYQYGTVYKNGFAGTGIDTGDSRPVQEVFHEALQTVSSPSKLVNGKMADFYVNEQKDIEAFSSRILSAVGSALVKENISGNFQVTDGYKVDAVRINEKTVVSEVTDSKKQIKGTVSQNGNNVTISVPESVFNPGENKFDYDLSKSIKAEEVNEDDEAEAPDDYTPAKEKVVLPQLTGKFKVGNYETTEIGSKTPTSIEVDEIKYCYPITKKSIADNDKSNDVGEFDDPVVKGKKAYEADLTTANENFTYTIDYSYYNTPFLFKENVMLVDPLDYRLEYVSAKVTDETGKTLSDYKIRTETKQDSAGNDRTVVVADVPKKENSYNHLIFKKVKLVVEAKIKEKYQTLSKDYIKLIQDNEGHGALDQASIMWNGSTDPNPNEHEKNGDNPSTIRRSNTVYVKPPVDTDITKAVNDKEHADLASVEEEFTYTVKSAWPGVADSYVLEDTVVDELEVVKDSISVTIGGRDYTKRGAVANLDGQTVKMSLDKETIAAINKLVLVRKPSSSQTSELADVVLTFKSKVRKGANLSKYITNDVIKIPNKAKVILNNNPKDSNEVTVTPPKPPTPSTPPIEKKVNGKEHADLETRGERFTYTIKTQVPENASAFKITDKLVDELDFVGEIEAKVDGKDIEKVVTTGDKKLEVELSEEDLKLVGKEIVITFKAEIKDGVDLSKYATNEGVKVPNVAKYEINNDPQYSKETKPVTVTPPQPPIEKKVNGETHADLKEIEDKFSYEIKTKVAEGASEFKVEDTLVDELEFTGETKATVDGTAVEGSRITKEGQKITLTLTEEEAKKAGKEVVLTFEAKIKDGADLTKYVKEGKVKVPNKGEYTYKIPNNPKEYKKPSNEVTVTPPPVPTQPPVEKKVNGKEHADLGTREEEFTYTIKTQVPEKASAFKVTDILVDELQFVGEVEAKVDGKAIEGSQIKKDGQKLEVELSEENLKQEGKEIVVTFKAKIKDGADLSKYETKDGTKVPNVAKYEINNNPKYTKETCALFW